MRVRHGVRIWALLAMKHAALTKAAALLLFSLVVLGGCASFAETVGDALPATQGELKEAVASVNDTVEGTSTGNAWMAGAGGLGILGFGALLARRMILQALNRYDEAPYVGPNGEEVNEQALVAAALANKPADPSSKS